MSMRAKRALIGAVAAAAMLAAGGTSAVSAQTYAPACSAPVNRALDFWIGEWEVEWSLRDGRSGRARSTVVAENGGCVIREHFRELGGGLEGTGIYSYFAPVAAWTQAWMDNQGVTISSTGGPSSEGKERFQLRLARGPDPNRQYRTVWEDVSANRFTWRFQTRAIGETGWTDESVSRYQRRN